jgi:hypothetical protein
MVPVLLRWLDTPFLPLIFNLLLIVVYPSTFISGSHLLAVVRKTWPMRKFYLIYLLNCLVLIASGMFSAAQCPAGSTTATVNWENLDYLTRTGTYTTFVTPAMMANQRFAIGKNGFNFNLPTAITAVGENLTNTAEAGSFGDGADVEFSGNGLITITFDTVVYNLRFSLYDIDASQSVRISAFDDAAVPVALNINMNVITAGIVTVTGSGTTIPTATTTTTAAANTETRGTLNITIPGNSPATARGVKRLTINLGFGGGIAGNFWLSDLSACVFANFPLNYYASQEPFIGQPSYYLVTPDNNSVYMINPVTGRCTWIFSETTSPWINSLAYDPINRIIYYVMDNPTPLSTNRSLKKYDMNTETISTVIADVSSIGIPLYDIRVESAGAAFYDGSLYFGVEGTNGAKNSNRESVIWKIDFDATLTPVLATQVFARMSDNGSGTLTHDWGDFIIKDGQLFNFNTGNQTTTAQFYHYNMQTGGNVVYNTNGAPAPIQAGQTWDGKLYWTGGQGSESGRVAPYNENGTIGTKVNVSVTACSPAWAGRAGDASDPFRPKSDFGDSPDSYDPVARDKATHEYDCNLRLGATFDREWEKPLGGTSIEDGADEDGIGTVTVLTPGVINYVQEIQVYNNTGAPATLAGWLDYDGDGIFEATEGKVISVPTNAAVQTISLAWLGIPVGLEPGSATYLRIRVTSSANGMTTGTPNKWFANGEVEDYRVPVDVILPVKMLAFSVTAEGNSKVQLNWTSTQEVNFRGYEVERSADGRSWKTIGFVSSKFISDLNNQYHYTDIDPLSGKSYYRLKLVSMDNSIDYSVTRSVEMVARNSWMTIKPNPVQGFAMLEYRLSNAEKVTISVLDVNGRTVLTRTAAAMQGLNQVNMNEWSRFQPGIYVVRIVSTSETLSTRVVVQ